jgi:hypothetical protein
MTLVGCEPGRNVSRDVRWSRVLRSALAAAVVLASTAGARPALAYCRTTVCPLCPYDDVGCPASTPIAWPTSCVSYTMQFGASKQIDLATATDVMEKSFAVWQEASCGDDGAPPTIRVDHRFGTAACTLHEYNQTDSNANIIMFRDNVWPYEGAANVLGLTTVTYSRKSGAIFDVDMEINATQHLSVDNPVPPSAYDLQSIITHEAGHFLGMAHSQVLTATMYPTYTSGSENFRVLDPDDVAGICAVFPPGAAAQCDANPRQGFSPECGIFPSGEGGKCTVAPAELAHRSRGRYGWLVAAGAVAAIALARRRRSHAEGR